MSSIELTDHFLNLGKCGDAVDHQQQIIVSTRPGSEGCGGPFICQNTRQGRLHYSAVRIIQFEYLRLQLTNETPPNPFNNNDTVPHEPFVAVDFKDGVKRRLQRYIGKRHRHLAGSPNIVAQNQIEIIRLRQQPHNIK